MHTQTKDKILTHATQLCALYGATGLSMRDLAKEIPLNQSVIYHYFADKDALLKEVYLNANKALGEARAELKPVTGVEEKLRQLVYFQIEHAELIVAVLRYYLYKREEFFQTDSGSLPPKATLHIQEVLSYGLERDEITVSDLSNDAKVITHLINGYLLEYFPHMPSGKEASEITDSIVNFVMRSLKR